MAFVVVLAALLLEIILIYVLLGSAIPANTWCMLYEVLPQATSLQYAYVLERLTD